MEIQHLFSGPRLGYLLKREWYEHRKFMLLAIAVIFILLVANAIAYAHNRENDLHEKFFLFLLFVGGFILTSLSFSEMNTATGKLFYLTLPASAFEKVISKWLLTSIGYLITYIMLYLLFTVVADGIAKLYDFSFIPLDLFSDQNRLGMHLYIAIQTIFLLGAIAFQKFEIFKTIVFSTLIWLLLAATCLLIFRLVMFDLFDGLHHFRPEMNIDGQRIPVEPNRGFVRFAADNASCYGRLLGLYIAPVVVVVASYFKLKEKEL
ncbi:MAG: hypothetical protein AAF960_29505 [Bacteroidota bacterium]